MYIYVYIQYVCIYIYMYLHNISTLFLESRQLILFAPFPRPKTAAPRSPLPRPPPVRPLRKRVKPASPGSAKTTRWMWSGVKTRQSFTTFFACKNFDTLLESYSKFYLTIDNWNHILHILTIEYSIYSIYSIYFTLWKLVVSFLTTFQPFSNLRRPGTRETNSFPEVAPVV